MYNVDLPSDRVAKASVEKRRNTETERRGRIFNDKLRTIGVDKEALDAQVNEKKQQEDAAKKEQNAYDADTLHNSKVAGVLQSRQAKEKRALEKAIDAYRHRHQQPRPKYGPNDPGGCGKADAQMMLSGRLAGEDAASESRLRRQREQLREWLVQQQADRAAERHQEKLEEQHYDRCRAEMDDKMEQLQRLQVERRKAADIATKDYNLAKIEEKRERDDEVNHPRGQPTGEDADPDTVGLPGLCPSKNRRAPPESLQQIIQFRKHQIEEKERIEFEKKQEEELCNRVRLDMVRAAVLRERQQARLNKQTRRQLDSSNVQLAETHKQKPDQRGCFDESFFSQFNTCSR
ncbi:RIB43A-like with coiled-coils protein 2 isoform X1 [Embiotoca jacksoni]|uniref:RIB43A-like with coiled-coils protein 2 isoform X1 n=1 Tax=Embiotoca jacksoni TaxID=100190 RepID=UPI0037044112